MTQKLKDLMDDAADLDFAPVDLDAVVRAGDRTVRRRRGITGLAALATAAVVGGVAYVGLAGDDGKKEQAPVVSQGTSQVSYVLDGTLHTESGSWELGHSVQAYVRTARGHVYVDDRGQLFPEGSDQVIGRTDARRPRVVADDEGTLVGWIDTSGEKPAYVVHDLVTGRTQRFDEHTTAGMGGLGVDSSDPYAFYAVDGRTAYFRDARGAVATDVDTGEATVLTDEAGAETILAVEDGRIASRTRPDPEDAEAPTLRISPGLTGGVELHQAYGSQAFFSPGGRWITVDADEPNIFDTRTGERVELDVDGRFFANGYQWLDDSTVAVIAARSEESPRVELLRCTVPDGSCTVVFDDLGTFDELSGGSFALPVGEAIG